MATTEELSPVTPPVGWIQTHSALRQQIRKIETDPMFPQAGLPDEDRRAIVGHLKSAIAEFDALLKEYPNT